MNHLCSPAVLGVLTWLLLLNAPAPAADETPPHQTFQAHDTFAAPKDMSADAQACLDGLKWKPEKFAVQCAKATETRPLFSRLVRFPSPVPSGNAVNDSVSMEWYEPIDADGDVIKAPAMLVVHESGSGMQAGRLFARALCLKGIHTFLIHLPHYGARRSEDFRRDAGQVLKTMQQAIADVRRARDAIFVLPNIDTRHIGIQGTSLGGFVVATSAGLDGCFTTVFIVLAGGDLYGMILNGRKDTAKLRRLLAEAGYTDDKLQALVSPVEPTRLAHRLDPEKTWLYSAEQDTVVPIKHAIILAKSAKLDKQHHIKLFGNHYSVIVHFPMIVGHMVKQIRAAAEPSRDCRP